MLFVPFVPPQVTSPRVQELARELDGAVARFRQRHPDLSPGEIRQALRLVRYSSGAMAQGPLLAVILGATGALGLGLHLFLQQGRPDAPGGSPSTTWAVPAIALAIVMAALLAIAVRRR